MQVIRLRKSGRTCDEIASQTGLSRIGGFDICKRHDVAEARTLRDAPSGRKAGDGRLLDAAQEATVRKLIADKTPDQLKSGWTRTARSSRPGPSEGPRFTGATLAACAACSANLSEFASISNMSLSAMLRESSSMMPVQ